MGEIDWEALLEGKELSTERNAETSGISGLHSVDSEISISGSTPSKGEFHKQKTYDFSDSGSLINLQSVNDLLAQSPSPEPYRSRSATSIKSNVTFSESEPEVFNIAEDINLMSIGDLSPTKQRGDYSGDNDDCDKLNNETEYTDPEYTDPETELNSDTEHFSEIDDEISEEIKTKSDGWKCVKDKLLNKGKKIPVFMVGPKKKKLSRDLSFTKLVDKSELSQMLSARKSSRTSLKSEPSSRRSSAISDKSYNYTSFTEDITTVSDTSELETVTQSKKSITEIKFQQPCCKCRCKSQAADLNIRPTPLGGMVLDTKTLDELSQMNPDKMALLNIMKAQYSLTKGLLDITSHIINCEIESCQPTARYTNIEETRRYIKKNQPFTKKRTSNSKKSSRSEKT